MPKPSVYNACMKGKTLGLEHACMSSCAREFNEKKFEVSSYKACKSMMKKSIPNHQFPWCRRGYDNTFNMAQEIFSETLKTEIEMEYTENLFIEDTDSNLMDYQDGKEEEIKEQSRPNENQSIRTSQQNKETLANKDIGKNSTEYNTVDSQIETNSQEMHDAVDGSEVMNAPTGRYISHLDESVNSLGRKKTEELIKTSEGSVKQVIADKSVHLYKTEMGSKEEIELVTMKHEPELYNSDISQIEIESTMDLSLSVNIKEVRKEQEPNLNRYNEEF